MKKLENRFIWFKTLSTGLIGFVHLEYWNEMNYSTNPNYQICDDSDNFFKMEEIAKRNNRAIHAMGGNKINKIIEEIRALKSLDEIDDLIERIKKL